MRTPLPVGTHLTFPAIGTQQQITVQIQELIGRQSQLSGLYGGLQGRRTKLNFISG